MEVKAEIFSLTLRGHRLTLGLVGWGCRRTYFGAIDGVIRVTAQGKGEVFRHLLRIARSA